MDSVSCLAIDMGAGSIRIVQGIFNDKLTLHEVYRFDNHIEHFNGHDRWNLKKIIEGINSGISKAIRESKIPIYSIGIDSWGVDFVLIGEDGKPVEDPVSYRDKRTGGMKEFWNFYMSQEETFQRTGINYNIFNTLYQLLSLKGSEVISKTKRILFMADYINYILSGEMLNELTLAASSQMLNCRTKQWDNQILEFLNINRELFDSPVKAGTRLDFFQNDVDLVTKVITVAGHDTACAVAAIPYENENFAFISTGTWCIMGVLSSVAFTSQKAFEMGITNEIAESGNFRPSKNLMGLWLIQQLRLDFGSKNNFTEIDIIASGTEESKFLIDTTNALFYNPDSMKKAFDKYLLDNYQIILQSEAQYYRCAYDSIVKSFQDTLLQFELLNGRSFNCLHITGGGSQSGLLCQLTANTLGIPVIAGPIEGAVIGNLMTQAKSGGFITSDEKCRELIKKSFEVVTYNPQ